MVGHSIDHRFLCVSNILVPGDGVEGQRRQGTVLCLLPPVSFDTYCYKTGLFRLMLFKEIYSFFLHIRIDLFYELVYRLFYDLCVCFGKVVFREVLIRQRLFVLSLP